MPIVLPALGATFWVNIIAEILIWSLLAASVNLLLGYVGLLSFGQALYFGFGMYGVALSASAIGASDSGRRSRSASSPPALMAAIAGALAVRLTWHYFAIITVVFSLIFYFAAMSRQVAHRRRRRHVVLAAAAVRQRRSVADSPTAITQYYFIFAICLVCYVAMAVLVASPLGLRFAAVRENDNRAALIGINVYLTRWIAFVVAGFTRRASAARCSRSSAATPRRRYMFYHVSGEAVVWAIVGGVGTLLGPLVGTGAADPVPRDRLRTCGRTT